MRRFYSGGDMERVQSVAEMAALAQRKLPHFAWEYLAGGAENEITLAANRTVFDRYGLEVKTLQPCHPPAVSRQLLGCSSSLPLAIAPTGFNAMLYPQADLELARAAARKGIPLALSTVSNATMEQVRAAAPDLAFWFQLYPMRDAQVQEDLIRRAQAVEASALLVTSDATLLGNREWDRRNFARPRQLSLRNKLDVLRHPGWIRRVMIPSGLPMMGNLGPYIPESERSALGSMKFIAEQMDTLLDWDKLARIRDQWSGRLVLKGVLHPDDAERAISLGIDALVVTNHGGRQLDGAMSGLQALARIAGRVNGRIELLMDSGIRRGSDVVKALALGANGVLLGRSTLYGVAAGGSQGAARVLDILDEELKRCLNLMGCPGIDDLGPEWLLDEQHTPRI
ncbi:alpha-hydroxy acid oxidase [Marinobacterium sp. YM272]|uniref:alpha-hydroxy acid oxidase n=1 Tax=Marinobacterium sp. YM272 TaxID=3421654 RepID=UPI003D7F5AA0